MTEIISVFGQGGIFITIGVMLFFSYRFYKRRTTVEIPTERLEYANLEVPVQPAVRADVFPTIRRQPRIPNPEPTYKVLCHIKLEEVTQRRGETAWVPKMNPRIADAYKVQGPNGIEWIFKIGSSDDGPLVLTKGTWLGVHQELQDAYKTNPGWAHQFNEGKQLHEVHYELPDILPEKGWNVADIGVFRMHIIAGHCEEFRNDDRTAFVTSRGDIDGEWMVFIDTRSDSKGPCGLYFLQQVNESILNQLSI